MNSTARDAGRMQPPNMAHLPPMPELKRIRRPLVKRSSKVKREAPQPVQSARPTVEPAFVGAVSAASREVPDVPLLPGLKDQPVSSGSNPEVPAVRRISDSQAPSPQGRFLQPASRHERLQQPTAPTQASHYPAPSSQKGFYQPPVPPKGSDYLYEGLGSRMSDYPAMLRLQHMSMMSMTSNIQAPTPCKKSTQPSMPRRVSDWSQQPFQQQRVSRPQAPVPPMVPKPKSPVLPVAPNFQAPPFCEKYQQLPGLPRVPDPFVPSEFSQCPRKVSDQTQSSHVWSQQPRDSNLQIPVSSKISSPQEPFPSTMSQQVSASWVSNPHAPSPWKKLHQPSVSSECSQPLQVFTKVSGPQMPVLPRVTNPQVPVLSSVSNPQELSPCEGFRQPPVLSSEWSQQLSTGHQHPPIKCVAEALQKLPDVPVPSSHGSSQYTHMIPKIPLESKAPIAYNSRKPNFTLQSRAPEFENASKQKQPNMQHALMQNTFLKQQYIQSHAMPQAYQQYQQSNHSVEQAHQKLNYQSPKQPMLNNIYGYRQQDSNLQSFPQLPSGYQRNGTVPCSVPQCRTYQEQIQMTQQYTQRKHTPTEVQPFLQQCQSSHCQPWPSQYNHYQQNLNMHNYQQQIQHKMQNKQHTPPGKIECIQQERQNVNLTKPNYDHRMNERTQPFLEKPVHYMRNPAEQIQYPSLQKNPTREQHENSKPLMQADPKTHQQLCDQKLLYSGWQMNPIFQQREDAQQNTKDGKEANAMLTFQTKYGQKPDHCTDNSKNLVYHASHESVEIYSQVSKIEVAKYSMSKAETKEQNSGQITNSPAFAQTAAMNVACQLSPPATPIDLRKVKEYKTVECPCPLSSIKADPDKLDKSFCKMSHELIQKDSPQEAKPNSRSPISSSETCNEYRSSTQNNTGLIGQAVKEYNLALEHQSAILSPKGFSVPLQPSRNPTIFSPTPPPTPPDERFPEWNKTATDNQRKRAGNDVQESTISSTPSAEDVVEKHSIENSTLPETEISHQSVKCPPNDNSQPIYVATQQVNREQAKISEIRIESSTLPETEISHQSVECPPSDNSQPIHLASQEVNREQVKIPKMLISLNPSGTHFISDEPLPLEDATQSALMSSEEHFADSSRSFVQPKEIVRTERGQRKNKKVGRKSKLQINIPLPERHLTSNQQESPLPVEPSTSVTETSTGDCGIQSLSSTQNETSHYVIEPSCIIDNSCSSMQPKDIVGTEREKKNKKGRKFKPQINMHPEKQLINQQESPSPQEPSTSVTENLTVVCGIQSLSSTQNETSHYATTPSCIINDSMDSQKLSSDNRTTQQLMSEEENVTDNKMSIDENNQTQSIATPPIENSHGFAKQETSTANAGIRNNISKCSVITDKKKPKTVSKHITSSVKMYDCLGSVQFISRCYRTMCFVCNKEVGGKNVINHLFFPHLKCKDCKTIIKSCQAYSLVKRSLRKGKTRTCCSVSGHHNFDRWNVSPVDFLTYKIRKFIAFREDRGYNNQPTEQEVIDEMEKYIKKLLMLQFLKPWKSAIRSCNKYIMTIKQTNSESVKQAKKRERAEDPEKENGKAKKARKSNNKNVRKPLLKTLSETSNTISSSHESCSQIAESTSFDKTTNRSEGTIAIQEQEKKRTTRERTVHKVPSIVTKVIQEPSQAKRSGEPQPMESESSLDAPLLELNDDFLLDSCNMDLLDQMTTYVTISDGP
ncbi:uncharacterized protein [Penaeus vannamei]|uniref:uncharacterized protein isoform X2 n=1 Tax=Penaeus vannamei TaxID=6689 RepID=UPI00387FAF1B